MFVLSVAAIMLGSQVSGWLAGRLSLEKTVGLGLGLLLLASLINILQSLLLSPTPLSVVAPLALYVLGMAVSMPVINLMALDCFPHNRGMASAMQNFVQMAFTALVVGAVVPLVTVSLPWMTLTMFALSLLGVMLWMLRGRSPPEERIVIRQTE